MMQLDAIRHRVHFVGISHLHVTSFESTARARPPFSTRAPLPARLLSPFLSSSASFRDPSKRSSFPVKFQFESSKEHGKGVEKTRLSLSLSFSLSLAGLSARSSPDETPFLRSRASFPPSKCDSSVRTTASFPVVYSTVFFSSEKFRVSFVFSGTRSGFRNDILSAFRTPLFVSRERELGRHEDSLENAVRARLLRRSSLVSFWSSSFRKILLPSLYGIRFSNRDSGIQNDCV